MCLKVYFFVFVVGSFVGIPALQTKKQLRSLFKTPEFWFLLWWALQDLNLRLLPCELYTCFCIYVFTFVIMVVYFAFVNV